MFLFSVIIDGATCSLMQPIAEIFSCNNNAQGVFHALSMIVAQEGGVAALWRGASPAIQVARTTRDRLLCCVYFPAAAVARRLII